MKKKISAILLAMLFCLTTLTAFAKEHGSTKTDTPSSETTVTEEASTVETSTDTAVEEDTQTQDDTAVEEDTQTQDDTAVEADAETEDDTQVEENAETEDDTQVGEDADTEDATEVEENTDDTSAEEVSEEDTGANPDNNKKVTKEELNAQKQARAEKKAEVEAAIKALKTSFKDADKEGKKAILAEIAKVKRELKDTSIGVFVSGHDIDFGKYDGVKPVIKENRTLIPVRAITEALGAEVQWNAETKEITITKEDNTVVLKIDSKTATVNGETAELDTAPTILGNRTLVPIRFISEALNLNVEWDADSQTVVIDE